MTRSHLLAATAQTLGLVLLSSILTHQLLYSTVDSALQHSLIANFTSAFNDAMNSTLQQQSNSNNTSGNSTDLAFADPGKSNWTSTIGTMKSLEEEIQSSKQSYWTGTLPKRLLIVLIMTPLQYFWYIYLERMFPARATSKAATYSGSTPSRKQQNEDLKGEEDDTREEEVVKRWIAKGKVQRSSVSWWNTFVKWALDCSLGAAWNGALFTLLWNLLDKKSFAVTLERAQSSALIRPFSNFLSIRPLAVLVSLIVVPAYRRVVFLAGADLISEVFFFAVVRYLVPWLLSTSFMNDFLGSMTEFAKNGTMKPFDPVDRPAVIDEL